MRLQKYLSRAGVASRRKAEGMILGGRVRVNGTVVRELGTKVDPDKDSVLVDRVRVHISTVRWLLLNKPAGVLCTRRDPGGGRTVFDLLPEPDGSLRYVGRLDRDTEGLLLLTNDGDVAHALLHPSNQIEREYHVRVEGEPGDRELEILKRGVDLEDGVARAREVRRKGPGALRMILTEGRKREVRRMLLAVGHPVVALRRVRFGPLRLGDLAPGQMRALTEPEILALKKSVGNGPD